MILLTNDDGIEAPGLAALEEAVKEAMGGEEYVIVAPAGGMSECSHCVTTQHAIKVKQVGQRRWAVAGTPADCVRVGLLHVLPAMGREKEIAGLRVYSGINSGGNLGADVYISGTIAAVREAAFFGIPGVAFSQYKKAPISATHWEQTRRWTVHAMRMLSEKTLAPFEFWSVNFPWEAANGRDVPEVVFCERSRRPLPVKYEEAAEGLKYVAGRYHMREYEKGSDIDVCFGGRIAVVRMGA